LIDVMEFKDCQRLGSYARALADAPKIFLGTLSPTYYSLGWLTIILFARLIALGLFLSILLKRFNRR
jgi:hypothetical protein